MFGPPQSRSPQWHVLTKALGLEPKGAARAGLAGRCPAKTSKARQKAASEQELGEAVTDLVARYHKPSASDGRVHRLVVLAHPIEEVTHEH